MTSQHIATHREKAEIHTGESLCKQKSLELLEEIHLPMGLLPLDDIVEVGYNRTTGFVWLKQKKRKDHRFLKIGRQVSYDTEVTAFVENRRMRRLTGVKTKELLFWVSISDIYVDEKDLEKITFGNPTGISRTFPVSAFELEEERKWGFFRYIGFQMFLGFSEIRGFTHVCVFKMFLFWTEQCYLICFLRSSIFFNEIDLCYVCSLCAVIVSLWQVMLLVWIRRIWCLAWRYICSFVFFSLFLMSTGFGNQILECQFWMENYLAWAYIFSVPENILVL